jgi:hypothetical protein
MEDSVDGIPLDPARAAIWAKFVKAVEERDFDTTRALFDAGELGQEHIWEEFELARECVRQIGCLQRLGSGLIVGTSPHELQSIEDFKAAQVRGLDLRRTGHLYLQFVLLLLLWKSEKLIEVQGFRRSARYIRLSAFTRQRHY